MERVVKIYLIFISVAFSSATKIKEESKWHKKVSTTSGEMMGKLNIYSSLHIIFIVMKVTRGETSDGIEILEFI